MAAKTKRARTNPYYTLREAARADAYKIKMRKARQEIKKLRRLVVVMKAICNNKNDAFWRRKARELASNLNIKF